MAFSFGTSTTNPTPGFGFGAPTSTTSSSSLFSTPASNFGGFGTTSTTQSTFGTGSSFGSTTGSTGGFGTGTSAFGAPTAGLGRGTSFGTTTGAFGTGSAFGATPGAFGTTSTFGAPGGAFGSGLSFGTPRTSAPAFSSFGGFGQATTTTTPSAFGGFGGSTSFGSGFGSMSSGNLFGQTQPQSQQVQQPTQNVALQELELIMAAVSYPKIFNDERDAKIAKWNQMQAAWGTGKGWYSAQHPPVEFRPENPFCRFKAVGYAKLPSSKDEDGLVALFINKNYEEVSSNVKGFCDGIQKILSAPPQTSLGGSSFLSFGASQQQPNTQSNPNIAVEIDGRKPLPEDKCEITIYVLERTAMGSTRRVPSSQLYPRLTHQNVRSQITALGITDIQCRARPTEADLKAYLDEPPIGIDPILWDQAKKDNPCPGNLIPVPMLGFTGLQRRLKAQELETKLHQGSLDGIASEIEELRSRSAQSTARRNELKEKQRHLGHRVIKAICRQEERRKRGLALLPEEEVLASGIEVLLQSLMAPGQSRGRLNELLSQRDRILSLPRASAPGHQFVFDESDAEGDRGKTFQQIEQLCRENQCALAQVIKTLKEDLQLMESCAREVREMTVR